MSRAVKVKNLIIGGGAPISVQSMCNTVTANVAETAAQIRAMTAAGCDIARLAVKNAADAAAICDIVKETEIPIVADIHFDYKLAIAAAEGGIHKVRINPGNIGCEDNVKQLAEVLGSRNIPVRVGVNSGSIEKEFLHLNKVDALVNSTLKHVSILEKVGFYNTVVSIKASDVVTTVAANRKFRSVSDCPLHLGVTEAGTLERGLIKSSAGIGALLIDGIGDTVRVSLTGGVEDEVFAGRYLLNCLGLRADMPEIVACPTCGRTEIPVERLAREVEEATKRLNKPIKIAVMGCVVNGLGEGADADVGVAGGKDKSVIFRKGQKIKTVDNCDILKELLALINE